MDDNHPNNPPAEENDPEWERIKAITPGLDEEAPADPPNEEVPANDPPPVDPPANDPPQDPDPENPPATDPPQDAPPADDPPQDPPADEDEDKNPPKRPEKYIPVAKYTSEKAEWKKEKDELERQLEAANASRGQEKEAAIKAYAEKHGVTEDSVRELLDLQAADKPQALDEALTSQIQEAQAVLAEKAYDDEYKTLAVPELKKLYPNASPEQLEAAKKEIEKIACSAEFLDKPLDFVVFKKGGELSSIFKGQPTRKGPEQGRQAPAHGNAEYTADDFKDGKTSFEELSKLPGDQQAKIIEAMDVKTYEQYSRFVDRDNKIVINRGGRKIEF